MGTGEPSVCDAIVLDSLNRLELDAPLPIGR